MNYYLGGIRVMDKNIKKDIENLKDKINILGLKIKDKKSIKEGWKDDKDNYNTLLKLYMEIEVRIWQLNKKYEEKYKVKKEISKIKNSFRSIIKNEMLFESVKELFEKENIEENIYLLYIENLHLIAIYLKNNGIGTTKLRKVYDQILDIYKNIKDNNLLYKMQMLRPKFAYLAGKNKAIENFVIFIDDIIGIICKNGKVNKYKLTQFKDMMEAILAYRKYIGNDN